MIEVLPVSLINSYLVHKQHLVSRTQSPDPVQITRDIVALHADPVYAYFLSRFFRLPKDP